MNSLILLAILLKTQIGRNIEEITSIRIRLLRKTFWCDYKTLLVRMHPDLLCF